jgi:hypothetical protein
LVTLGDKHPSYFTVKNWVAKFRTGHLSTEGEECSGRPTQGTVPENVDAIHSTILYEQRISAKKVAETLLISWERVGIVIMLCITLSQIPASMVSAVQNYSY